MSLEDVWSAARGETPAWTPDRGERPGDDRTLADMFAYGVLRDAQFAGERVEDLGGGRLRVHFSDGSCADFRRPVPHATPP